MMYQKLHDVLGFNVKFLNLSVRTLLVLRTFFNSAQHTKFHGFHWILFEIPQNDF